MRIAERINRLFDLWLSRPPALLLIPDGVDLISQERWRQINTKGFTGEHDRQHSSGELAAAALVYAAGHNLYEERSGVLVTVWPWEPERLAKIAAMPPKERLTKAGALIAAALDRTEMEEAT